MNEIRQSDYQSFLKEIKEKILEAQYKVLKAVNRELISLNWDIGKSVVETLSKDLQNEFPGIQGLSSHNLWRMRKFYLACQENEKLAPMVQEIGWTKSVLIHQIESEAYERYLHNQTSFDKALEEKYRHQANQPDCNRVENNRLHTGIYRKDAVLPVSTR